ncbi:hypothetical protein [Streptomyces sp. NPDC096323]|uniref:hypothetical protein n=1 Tax=Streptomyces sp. NPDC096323 TaxID=3155822 RepID=UPI00332D52E8
MTEHSPPPGDPSQLYLRISYDDELWDAPQADTLECWNVAVRHRRRTHGGQDSVRPNGCMSPDCPACKVEDVAVGAMTFYRVHLDRGRNAYWAMEELSEELYETAQALLDPETGFYRRSQRTAGVRRLSAARHGQSDAGSPVAWARFGGRTRL